MGWNVVDIAYGAEADEIASGLGTDFFLSGIHLKYRLGCLDVSLGTQGFTYIPVAFLVAYLDDDTVNFCVRGEFV